MFLTVSVNGETLQVGAFDQNGDLLDSWQLNKTK